MLTKTISNLLVIILQKVEIIFFYELLEVERWQKSEISIGVKEERKKFKLPIYIAENYQTMFFKCKSSGI